MAGIPLGICHTCIQAITLQTEVHKKPGKVYKMTTDPVKKQVSPELDMTPHLHLEGQWHESHKELSENTETSLQGVSRMLVTNKCNGTFKFLQCKKANN